MLANGEIENVGGRVIGVEDELGGFVDHGFWSGVGSAQFNDVLEFQSDPVEAGKERLHAAGYEGTLAFLNFPAIVAHSVHLDEFPWPPDSEMMQMVGGLDGGGLKARRRA